MSNKGRGRIRPNYSQEKQRFQRTRGRHFLQGKSSKALKKALEGGQDLNELRINNCDCFNVPELNIENLGLIVKNLGKGEVVIRPSQQAKQRILVIGNSDEELRRTLIQKLNIDPEKGIVCINFSQKYGGIDDLKKKLLESGNDAIIILNEDLIENRK